MDKTTDSKPMPDYQAQRAGNDKPDFAPRKGEGQAAAGARVRDAVREVARKAGQKPANLG